MTDKPEDEQQNGDAERTNTQQTIGVSTLIQEFRSFIAEYKSAHDENRNHNQSVHTWTRRAAFGVFIYTALTLGIVVIALCQLHTSRDSEERQLRAYVFMTQAALPVDDTNNLVFHGVIKNFGLTPAYEYENWTCLAIRDISLKKPSFPTDPTGDLVKDIQSKDTTGHFKDFTISIKSILAPGDIRTKISAPFCDHLPFTTPPLTSIERSGIESGDKQLYVFGEITYRDAFGIPRYTKYRLISDRTHLREGLVSDANEGNDAN